MAAERVERAQLLFSSRKMVSEKCGRSKSEIRLLKLPSPNLANSTFSQKVEFSLADSLERRTAKNEGAAAYPKPCTLGIWPGSSQSFCRLKRWGAVLASMKMLLCGAQEL